jgi:hypothetical protein
MNQRLTVAHRLDFNNVGDMASEPLQYFLPRDAYDVIDIADIANARYDVRQPLILGGGGLLGNDYLGDAAESVLTIPDRHSLQQLSDTTWQIYNPKLRPVQMRFQQGLQDLIARSLESVPRDYGPRFLWGAGHNNNDIDQRVKYSRYLAEFRMVGIRDWHGQRSRIRWTPCASCMHPAFDRQYQVRNDVIWFEHRKQLVKDFGDDSIPRFVNSGNNIEQVIELLASANTVLTNSYHGAYWATLLRRRVIVVGAWSTKFRFMRFQPQFIKDMKSSTWQQSLESAKIYPEALDVCRVATQQFWQDLQENLAQDHSAPAQQPEEPVSPQLSLDFDGEIT